MRPDTQTSEPSAAHVPVTDQERRGILEAFEERFRLEAHHIHRAPELLFPQMYNHLTWLDAPDGPLHARCEDARSAPGRTAHSGWLRMVQDPRPAPPQWSLSLGGHTDNVSSVVVTPDGAHIVSGSRDNAIKV